MYVMELTFISLTNSSRLNGALVLYVDGRTGPVSWPPRSPSLWPLSTLADESEEAVRLEVSFGVWLERLQLCEMSGVCLCSSVSIATRYGLVGQGIESRWGRDFPYLSRPALGSTHPPIQWVPGVFPGDKTGRIVVLTTHPILRRG
jgi:hypothetical protein